MINESKIKKLDNRFNCKSEVFNNTIQVTTQVFTRHGKEKWLLIPLGSKVKICHIQHTKSGDIHYHKQRYVTNLYCAYDSINSHKPQYKKMRHMDRMNELFNLIGA